MRERNQFSRPSKWNVVFLRRCAIGFRSRSGNSGGSSSTSTRRFGGRASAITTIRVDKRKAFEDDLELALFLLGVFVLPLIEPEPAFGIEQLVRDAEMYRIGEGATDVMRPFVAREALNLGACVGHEFDLGTLSLISQRPGSDLMSGIWEALRGGLLTPLDARSRFLAERPSESMA